MKIICIQDIRLLYVYDLLYNQLNMSIPLRMTNRGPTAQDTAEDLSLSDHQNNNANIFAAKFTDRKLNLDL